MYCEHTYLKHKRFKITRCQSSWFPIQKCYLLLEVLFAKIQVSPCWAPPALRTTRPAFHRHSTAHHRHSGLRCVINGQQVNGQWSTVHPLHLQARSATGRWQVLSTYFNIVNIINETNWIHYTFWDWRYEVHTWINIYWLKNSGVWGQYL